MKKKMSNPPNRIREWRLSRDMTLAHLSKLTGIDTAYISKMELGDRRETVSHLRVIAKHLHCTVGDLLNAEDSSQNLSQQEKRVVDAMRGDDFIAHLIVSVVDATQRFNEIENP